MWVFMRFLNPCYKNPGIQVSPLIKIQIDNTSIEIYREIPKEMLSDVFSIIKEQC